jgi:DNA-binding transcriptional LysR family regulator
MLQDQAAGSARRVDATNRRDRMDKLSELSVFVQVADSGSYAGAARALGITPSAVGKTIVRLEEQLEVRLFHRNTSPAACTSRPG